MHSDMMREKEQTWAGGLHKHASLHRPRTRQEIKKANIAKTVFKVIETKRGNIT